MESFRQMLTLQVQLFLLIAAGIFLKRAGIVDGKGRKTLTSLLIGLIMPCNIINSYLSGAVSGELLVNCALALLVCTVLQILCITCAPLLFRRYPEDKRVCLIYGIICSNAGFIGLPVVDTLYGSVGVIYGSFYQIPMRFTMWSAGVGLFAGAKQKDAWKKLATHPCIIAAFAGLGLMMLPVRLPEAVSDTIASLSRCTTPISMLVIGSILAEADWKSLISRPVVIYVFIRLLLLPLLVYGALSLFPVDRLMRAVCVIMTGMPAGSTTPILAEQYGRDSLFASQLVFASTVMSMVTLPLLCLFL